MGLRRTREAGDSAAGEGFLMLAGLRMRSRHGGTQ
jgi:hypothetical protein